MVNRNHLWYNDAVESGEMPNSTAIFCFSRENCGNVPERMMGVGLFAKEKVVNKVCLIPVEDVHPNPEQPRKHFDEEELRALSESIAENGLLQPISLLKEEDGSYRIIAGERRYRACRMLGMPAVPAIVCNISEEDAVALALIENIQRSDLNCFEEAQAIENFIEKLDLTQEQAAKKLGKSQSAVANKLRLLKLR